MKRYIIILILLLAGNIAGWATDVDEARKKQLLEVSVMKHDSLRLQKLNDLVSQSFHNPEDRLFYIGELLREAELQKNKRYMAKSYLLNIYVHYNEHDENKIDHWMRKLEPLARKEGYYDYLFEGKQCVVELLVMSQEFELAEQKSKQILVEAKKTNQIDGMVAAYKCMANVYRATYRFEKSAEMLEEAYKLSPKMNNSQSKIELITYLISIYKYTDDNSKWLKYLNIKEKEIKKLIASDPSQKDFYKGDLMMTYLSYLGYCIETGNKSKAAYYKQLVDEYKCSEYAVYQLNYFKGLADYYQFMEQWEKALEYRSKQCEVLKPLSYRDYPYHLLAKSEILFQMGREKEALETVKEVVRIKDTVRVSIFSKQIEQIKKSYDSSRELLEQARIQRYFQYSVLGVVIILIIIFSYFAYRYYHIKRSLTDSERKIRQVAEEVQKATKTKERFLSNMSYAIRTPLNEVVNRSLLLASKQQLSEKEREEVAQTILDTSSDLMKLVEEILDLSRLEAGRMKFSVSDVDVNALVRDAVGSFAASDVEIISSFPETGNVWIHIDGMRLMQVFSSLLSDIEKGKKVVIELKEESEDVLSVRITHTIFAAPEPTQEIIIRNEINRMIIEHFGGSYKIVPNAVLFTLKIVYPL